MSCCKTEVWYSQTLQQHEILLRWDTNSPSFARGMATLNDRLVLWYMQEAFDNQFLQTIPDIDVFRERRLFLNVPWQLVIH